MKQWPTAARHWHFALHDVSCRQSCHVLGSPSVTILSASSMQTLVNCVVKYSRPPDLKSSSNVSFPFAWITGPATHPSYYQNSRRKCSIRIIILSNLVYDWMDTWIAAQCSGLDSLMRRHRSGKMHWYKGWGSSFSKSSWSFCTCTCTCIFSARIWHSSSRWRSLQVHVSSAVHNGSWHRWHLDYKGEYKTSSE